MTQHHTIELGVNVDHIATLRQARGTSYPDPMQAADIARTAGADGVTVHLREDRRHIQDYDVFSIKGNVRLPMNLEMAATEPMLAIATQVNPHECCLVPEKRAELTTEGGLNVADQVESLKEYVQTLQNNGILVSLFIDPQSEQVLASKQVGANIVELHTGNYADCPAPDREQELQRIITAAKLAVAQGLQVNAGHGLNYQNVAPIASIVEIKTLNIGHSIVARACITGLHEAVFTMKQIIMGARIEAEAKTTSD